MSTQMRWIIRSPRSLINRRSSRRLLLVGMLALCAQIAPSAPGTSLVNISSLASSQTGESVIVTEFAIQGTAKKKIALRALGPSLSDFRVPDPLQNPILTLLNARGRLLDVNDNWMDNPRK